GDAGAVVPASYWLEGRNGLNCLELIFGKASIGLPALVDPNQFDFGQALPLNAMLRSPVGIYAIQHYSEMFRFDPSKISIPTTITGDHGEVFHVSAGFTADELVGIYNEALGQAIMHGVKVDAAFRDEIYNTINGVLRNAVMDPAHH